MITAPHPVIYIIARSDSLNYSKKVFQCFNKQITYSFEQLDNSSELTRFIHFFNMGFCLFYAVVHTNQFVFYSKNVVCANIYFIILHHLFKLPLLFDVIILNLSTATINSSLSTQSILATIGALS